jgi:hypothetical protein
MLIKFSEKIIKKSKKINCIIKILYICIIKLDKMIYNSADKVQQFNANTRCSNAKTFRAAAEGLLGGGARRPDGG